MMSEAIKPVGRIKTAPEDFQVQEWIEHDGRLKTAAILKDTMLRSAGATSDFTQLILTKRGIESQKAYQIVADQLGVHRSNVTDHGMKDATAVTSQLIVVKGPFRPTFHHEHMWLGQVGPAEGPLGHGQHDGNRFKILVRTDEVIPPTDVSEFLNLYGPQRFGDGRQEIGKYLLEGNFTAALELLEGSMNWPDLERIMRRGYTALEALHHPDFRKVIKFKIQQWQSWMWNKVAEETSRWHVPMWGHSVAEKFPKHWTTEMANKYSNLWDPTPDQLHPEMVQLAHSFIRRVKVQPENPVMTKHPDGFLHEFTLPSGVYATVYLAQLYDLRDMSREKFKNG